MNSTTDRKPPWAVVLIVAGAVLAVLCLATLVVNVMTPGTDDVSSTEVRDLRTEETSTGTLETDTDKRNDPGIEMCRNAESGTGIDGSGDQEWTFRDYQSDRQILEGSQYDEIREPALKLVDVAWQIEQLGQEPGPEALTLANQISEAYTQFSAGCAQHGIQVPAMNDLQSGVS